MSLPPGRKLLEELKGNANVFIETGSYRGDAIKEADDAGYQRIESIDIDSEQLRFCMNRFDLIRHPGSKGITLWIGDSAVFLWKMIENINERMVFWLDSHSQLFEDEPPSNNPFPLLEELRQIARHPIKDHTLIIDDILILTHPDVTGWSRETIEAEILKINPEYKIEYTANPIRNNILIAHL